MKIFLLRIFCLLNMLPSSCLIVHDIMKWFLTKGDVLSRELVAMSAGIFDCHDWEESTLLASIQERQGMLLLNILQSTRQPPVTKNFSVPNVHSAEAEKP